MSDTTLKPETETMGRVIVRASVSNLEDLWRCERGEIAQTEIRSLELDEALVDTGCIGLAMPESMIARLGLREVRTKTMRSTNGTRQARVYQAARLEVQGRDCVVEVTSLPEDSPVLIGQVPLEIMDFVVDPQGQQLIGNPAHGGEWENEMY